MGAYNEVTVIKIFFAESVAASGTADSEIIDLGGLTWNGEFGLQVEVSGSGTCKFEALMSNHKDDFILPSTQPAIKTGFTASSGPSSDGKDAFSFSPILHSQMKIRVTETGTSDSVTVTAYLALN